MINLVYLYHLADSFCYKQVVLIAENQIKNITVKGINANKKEKKRKVRVCGNKNSTNNWGLNAQGWTAVHKAVIAAE